MLCRLNSPTPDEKQDIAESIVQTFPVLQDGTASGYVSIGVRSLIIVCAPSPSS